MAPLPTNDTGRVWIDYTSGGIEHSLLLRFDAEILGNTTVVARVNAIVAAMQGAMWSSDAVIGGRYSEAGSVVSLPLVINTGAGSLTAGTPNPESNAGFAGVSGRSTGGRQYHADFFTQAVYTLATYREDAGALPSELSDFFLAFADNTGMGAGTLVAVDALQVVFKQYLNLGQNAYWQRAQR